MEQLILNVENESILPLLRRVISAFDGVSITKKRSKKAEKTGLELALDDVKNGRVTKWDSVDDMFNTLLNE